LEVKRRDSDEVVRMPPAAIADWIESNL